MSEHTVSSSIYWSFTIAINKQSVAFQAYQVCVGKRSRYPSKGSTTSEPIRTIFSSCQRLGLFEVRASQPTIILKIFGRVTRKVYTTGEWKSHSSVEPAGSKSDYSCLFQLYRNAGLALHSCAIAWQKKVSPLSALKSLGRHSRLQTHFCFHFSAFSATESSFRRYRYNLYSIRWKQIVHRRWIIAYHIPPGQYVCRLGPDHPPVQLYLRLSGRNEFELFVLALARTKGAVVPIGG